MGVHGWMVRREVEGPEVVVVALDVRPLGPGKAQAAQDVRHLVHDERKGVPPAPRRGRPREREVEAGGSDLPVDLGGLEDLAALGEGRFDALLEPVGLGAQALALFYGEVLQAAQERGKRSLAAQVFNAELF